VITPDAFTEATPALDDDHVIVRPVRRSLPALRSVAVASVLEPAMTDVCASCTLTLATEAGVTVSVAEPVRPSLVAVMIVVPGATALTSPAPLTVAMPALEDVQVTVRPLSS
jgi:hypothetical protein